MLVGLRLASLGIRFVNDIANTYPELDYGEFVLGLIHRHLQQVTLSPYDVSQLLKNELLNRAERSEQFLEEYQKRSEVHSTRGIFYRVLNSGSSSDTSSSGKAKHADKGTTWIEKTVNRSNDPDLCNAASEPDESSLKVKYACMKPIGAHNQKWSKMEFNCGTFNPAEVIRGWRTALQIMEPGDLWEVVVPATLAYGSVGAEPEVEKNEALRFLLEIDQ